MDAFLFQDPDVALEIRNHGRKCGNRDVECGDILYEAVLLVREFLPGQHHVIQGYGKLTRYGMMDCNEMLFSCNEKGVFKTQVNVTLWGDTADSFRVSMETGRL